MITASLWLSVNRWKLGEHRVAPRGGSGRWPSRGARRPDRDVAWPPSISHLMSESACNEAAPPPAGGRGDLIEAASWAMCLKWRKSLLLLDVQGVKLGLNCVCVKLKGQCTNFTGYAGSLKAAVWRPLVRTWRLKDESITSREDPLRADDKQFREVKTSSNLIILPKSVLFDKIIKFYFIHIAPSHKGSYREKSFLSSSKPGSGWAGHLPQLIGVSGRRREESSTQINISQN